VSVLQLGSQATYAQRGAWADWLYRFPFTHFETFTFQDPRKTTRSCLGSLRRHSRRLSWAGIEARYFAVVEGDARVRLHLHTLSMLHWKREMVCPPTELQYKGKGRRWDALALRSFVAWLEAYGRCKSEPISGGISGYRYVAKYILKNDEPRSFFLPDRGWGPYLPE